MTESFSSSSRHISLTNMDENSTMESSSLPIIEDNEKFLSTIVTSTELLEKIVTSVEEEEEVNRCLFVDKNNLSLSNLSSNQSPTTTEMIISTLMDNLLTQIEQANENRLANEQETSRKQQRATNEVKQTTRLLRSHARKKIMSTMENHPTNENRRVSDRQRLLEKKHSFDTNERPRRKKTISERSSTNETSSNSDDQPIENHSAKIFTLKSSIIERLSANEDTNLDEDSNSTNPNKQIPGQIEINSLPPMKRRLRERNITLFVPSEPTEESPSVETNSTRDIPINGIKQFLQIRQQVNEDFAQFECKEIELILFFVDWKTT